MSIDEIQDKIQSFNRVKKMKLKEKVANNYSLSLMIRQAIGSILDKDTEMQSLYTFYPELFKEEKEFQDKEDVEKQLLIHKERMRDFAMRFNEKRKNRGNI